MYSENKVVAGNLNIKERDYWLNKLSGDLEKTHFYYDYQRNYSKEVPPGKVKFRLPDEYFSRLTSLSKESDHTLHIILLAGLAVLLYKYTGADDIMVGSPIYRQDVQGEFVNTVLALRNPIDGKKTFKELLLEVKNTVLEAMAHQNYPIETLVYLMGMNADDRDFPLFDIVLMLENIHDETYIQHIKTNMTFSFLRSRESLEGVVKYNASLYKRETIERTIRHYMKILKEAAVHLDARISGISLLAEKEREQVLFEFNDTKTPLVKDKCYHHLFEEKVEENPDDTAAIYKEQHITYRELNETANRIAAYLQEKGVNVNTVVGVYMKRSIEMLAAMIGIFKTGGIYLPIEMDYPETRVGYILGNSEAKILITSRDNPRLSDEMVGPSSFLTGVLYLEPGDKIGGTLPGHPLDKDKINDSPDNLAYIIYTSGTTGKPKGVMIHHLGMLNHLYAKINDLSVTGTDIIAQTASACFDISIWQFLAALLQGGATCIIDKEVVVEPGKFLQVLQKNRVTILESVPSLMTLFLDMVEHEKDKGLKHLRWMVPTGEPLTPHLARQWYRHYPGIKLVNAYGPTETSDDVTHYVLAGPPPTSQVSVPVGKPLQNLHIYILDKDLSLCPMGVKGEICVAGIGVGKGYWKDAQKTAAAFIPNPYLDDIKDNDYSVLYKTGDTGYFRTDGTIECLGRMDHQVKIRGNRIELGEIETQITARQEIKDALVTTKKGENGYLWLCAYIIPYSRDRLSISVLRNYLLEELPDYMVPSFFVQLERFPTTPNGKIDRQALPEPELEAADMYCPPGNKTEQKLAEVWAGVLRREKDTISVNANFFELGGHSLNATVMASNIHKKLDVKVPLTEIFKYPTIRTLSRYIEESAQERHCPIKIVEKKEYYPLSSAQQRLYILQQMALDSIGYNLPFVVILEGKSDLNRVEKTFRQLIKQHESLRTSFEVVGETPVQKIHEHIDFAVELYDLPGKKTRDDNRGRYLDPGEINQRVIPIVDEFIRPFDLTKAPLLRMGFIKLETEKHILMVDMHHIITDGVSSGIFIKDFMSLYDGGELPAPGAQYKDFSAWQQGEKAKDSPKKKEEFWLKEFTGEAPVLSLPADFPRSRFLDFEGSSVDFQLGRQQTRKLKEMAIERDTTLYILLLIIYNILLSKLSGQEEIVVGSPTAGRNHTDLENVIGMFVNTLPLKNFPAGCKRFTELLAEVKERTLAAFENQEYQYEDLVDKVVENRDLSRNPLFDVIFLMQNMEIAEIDITGLKLTPFEFDGRVSKFDLAFSCKEAEEKLLFTVVYSTKLFLEDTILRFIEYFKKIVSGVLDNKDTRIADIEVISREEREQLLDEFNDTDTVYPAGKMIHELFEEQVERTPGNIAVVGRSRETYGGVPLENLQITYRELNQKSDRLADLLKEKGVQADVVVGLMAERSIEMVIGIMGILKAGGAFLPIENESPLERINFILADSSARALVTTGRLAKEGKKVMRWEGETLSLENLNEISSNSAVPVTSAAKKSPMPAAHHQPTAASLAYVIYTSGSTGNPKGVMVEHRSIVNYIRWAIKQYVKNEKVDYPLFTSPSFDLTLTSIFTPLLSGSAIVVYDGEYKESLIEKVIEENRVGVVKLTPSHLKLILEPGINFPFAVYDHPRPHIKRFIVGGEALETKLASEVVEKFHGNIEIYNEYGPTEAAVGCMIYRYCPGADTLQSVPIGIPAHNIKIYILDKERKPVPVNVAGEMYISGRGVARGYLNRPELTQERFVGNPFLPGKRMYKTGDLARHLPGGNIEFLGRIDQQVKIRGFRIEPGEIETKLQGYNKNKPLTVSHQDFKGIELKNIRRCQRCLLSANYPGIHFDEEGVCNICGEYEKYKEEVDGYFKGKEDFQRLLKESPAAGKGEYDCLLLYSGGKDSTYVLYQLIDMGLKVLTFTFDNGYISDAAFANIKRTTSALKVENIVCKTENMNKVFVESLNANSNVCHGCWHALNTLGAKVAHEHGINLVISGLSRGQIFEMRLEGLFQQGIFAEEEIEENLRMFRKSFHSGSNKFSRILDVQLPEDVVEQIHFIDFFRYFNCPVLEIRDYLTAKGWTQPEDTGFCSSNCIINDVGIYVHLKRNAYHFYEPQLSWDCRLGSITREDGLKEIAYDGDWRQVGRILEEIGYYKPAIKKAVVRERESSSGDRILSAYIVSDEDLVVPELREYLAGQVPDYMIPSEFIRLDKIPLTTNGKIDEKALKGLGTRLESGIEYVAPNNETEQLLTSIWMEVLGIEKIGIDDNFFNLGGNSMLSIKVINKVKTGFKKDVSVADMFRFLTIRSFAGHLDQSESVEDSLAEERAEKIDEGKNRMKQTMGMMRRN